MDKRVKKKVTFIVGDIDIVLIRQEQRQLTRNVKAIPGELQHTLVKIDIDKKKIRKVVRKTCAKFVGTFQGWGVKAT